MNMFRLDGKVALVTGAGNGLGLATVEMLAEQGSRVAAWDLDTSALESLAEIRGGGIRNWKIDVSEVARFDHVLGEVLAEFGRIDILVNNAAICPRISFAESTEKDWDRIMDINAKSQFFLMQKVCPIMKSQGGGRIINIASTSARMGALANASIYSATKAAIVAMSKSIAREVARDGILVNCVAPGTMDTSLMRNLPEEKIRELSEDIPLGRLATPSEIASSICYLASEESSYCTGATFDINGGFLMF